MENDCYNNYYEIWRNKNENREITTKVNLCTLQAAQMIVIFESQILLLLDIFDFDIDSFRSSLDSNSNFSFNFI